MKKKIKSTKADELMFKELDKLKAIDIEQESRKILVNPQVYFDKYLKSLNKKCTILAKFEIYLKIKIIDLCDGGKERAEKDAIYFINKYSISGYLDILNQFYSYALNIVNELLSEGVNTILDLYNEDKISKSTMEKAIVNLKETNESMEKDKIILIESIDQIELEKRKNLEIQERMNNDFDQPY